MRARDVMSRPVRTVRDTDPVEQAVALLAEYGISAAPVLDATGELVGIVSQGDLLERLSAARRHAVVRDVMSTPVLTVYPEVDVTDIAELMVERHLRSVPVVDDGELVGVVSRLDVLRTVVRTDDALCLEVQHRLDDYAGDVRRWTVAVDEGIVSIAGRFEDEAERRIVTILARTVPGVLGVRDPVAPAFTTI